jgi:DNA-binding SARP family transcriptional activator
MKPGAEGKLLICLLGGFRVMTSGADLPVRAGGKSATLLSTLAMRERHWAPREALLGMLWPDAGTDRSIHSLNSLVHALRQHLGGAIAGAPPVVYSAGGYALNAVAGVGTDIAEFDAQVRAAGRLADTGDVPAAAESWMRAVALYRGDLTETCDLNTVVERERLRATYLTLLSRLADHRFAAAQYPSALAYAMRLLAHDPCREDAHRLVMCCHVRLGERAQALRQFRICQHVLATEFAALPEPSTTRLYDQIRLDPASV